MTPVYNNGNDYYKKMLELQRRLRQSEEERMRLEERFTLLEHESRSRHETCINRLRMRYIEFLEEQQARDERNHKLLGALDRVDSSLALISAQTNRLGTMRRQYEAASLLENWHISRRVNKSVAGDSGIASQTNDSHLTGSRQQDRLSINKYNNTLIISSVHPNTTTPPVKNLVPTNYSPSNQPSNSRYDFRRPAKIHQEKHFQTLEMPYNTSSLSSSIEKSDTNIRNNGNPKYFVDNRPQNASQSFQQISRKYWYDYPCSNNSVLKSSPSPLRSPNDSPSGYSRYPATRRASLVKRDLSKRTSPIYSGFIKDISTSPSRSPSRFSKVIGISNQDKYGNDDDNDVYDIGDIVEDELEQYMTRIPKLYRDYPQSPDELDQEQNTSGDLLNVTFSDDDVDFSVQDRTRNVGRTSSVKFEQGLSQPKPESEKLSRSELRNVYQNTSVEESGNFREAELKGTGEGCGIVAATRQEEVQHGIRDAPIAPDVSHRQLSPITSLSNPTDICDKSRSANNEEIAARANNGISLNVARDSAETGTRPSTNNDNIARVCENSNSQIDANTTEIRQLGRDAGLGRNTAGETRNHDAVNIEKSSADPGNLNPNEHTIFNSEDYQAGINYREFAEELEPWNPSEFEKKVQSSMVMKDASQFDSIQRQTEQLANDERWAAAGHQESEINVSGTDDVTGQQLQKEGIDKYAAGINDTGTENIGTSSNNQHSNGEKTRKQGEVSDELSFKEYKESDASPIVAAQSIDQSSHDPNKLVDPNVQYERLTGVEDTYGNQESAMYAQENYPQNQMQYEYAGDDQYREGSNAEQYHQQDYNPQDNEQYEGGTSGGEQFQYQVDDQRQYQEYNIDQLNAGQEYAASESNNQYSTDNNQQYVNDSNDQYVTDTNEQYATDNNAQYVTDTNEQYATDTNAQYVTDTNEQYATDTNAQYATDTNAQYVTDTNEQYATDTNAQYVTDTDAQYVTDLNEQYVTDPNQQYISDPNQQYVIDQNQEYSGDGQQHSQNTIYVQDRNQEYAGNEAYEQNALSGNEDLVTESGRGQELETSVEPDNSLGYSKKSDESAPQEPQTEIRDDQTNKKSIADDELDESTGSDDTNALKKVEISEKKTKDVIKSLLDSDTESTIEKNVSNAESDFDFN